MDQKHIFSLLALVSISLPFGCADRTANYPVKKFVVSEARNVVFDGPTRVDYDVSIEGSASKFLGRLGYQWEQEGWTKIKQPGESVNIVGYSAPFKDRRGVEMRVLYQDVQRWTNQKGETFTFFFGQLEGNQSVLDPKEFRIQVVCSNNSKG